MAIVTDMAMRDSDAGGRVDDYFALKNGDDLVTRLLEKIADYQQFIEQAGYLSLWKRSYKNYYFGLINNGRIKTGGEKNQYLLAPINHYANILAHLLNNVTSQRPNLKARATNTDFKSMSQTKIANHVLEYWLNQKGMEEPTETSAELALIFGEAFVLELWDAFGGEPVTVDPETQRTVNEGDVMFRTFSPLDAIRDYSMPDHKSCKWFIFREAVNKWDLAAQYPQYAEQIASDSSSMQTMRKVAIIRPVTEKAEDKIYVYHFVHLKSSAVPSGRYVLFLETQNTILNDSPLPNKYVVHRIAPKDLKGTIFGYTVGYDLLPIQENLNILYSVVATNQANFGVQSVLTAKGSGLQVSSLQGGLKIVEYNVTPGVDTRPSALQLTATPPEIFNHVQHLIQQMEMISGVNSVVRGQPEASLKSGAALALMASQSIQFMSKFQNSYTKLLESMGTGLIDILKTYATTPRIISISGKSNNQYIQEFKGSDLEHIDRVTAEVTNALSRTTAGKLQIAQDLMQTQDGINTKQYLTVLETGTIDPMTEGFDSQLMLIKNENEALSKGEMVQATYYDLHDLHIKEHATVLANLEARKNPEVIKAVSEHIQQHIELLKTLDPVVANATGQQVMAPPPGNAAPPQSPGNPGDSMGMIADPTNPILQQSANARMPSLPVNPLSGQKFNNQTGGL